MSGASLKGASYIVSRQVLVETRELLAEVGRKKLESVVVWIGRLHEGEGEVLAAVRPRQYAYRWGEGVGVEIPGDAIAELISALPAGTLVLARVHTHPGEAYHSDVDDLNLLIAHEGAISIVVPNFAAEPINLSCCSVNELQHGEGWVELDSDEVRTRFEVL
jgi:hypothetical protein